MTATPQIELDLSSCDQFSLQRIYEDFERGDAEAFVMCRKPGNELGLVLENWHALKDRGILEAAVFHGFISTKHNYSNWETMLLVQLFCQCDRRKLRAMGSPLPAGDSITVYRGVSGKGKRRRCNGISWTTSLDVACWFALWDADLFGDPGVYKARLLHDEVFCCTNNRGEHEVIGCADRCRRIPMTMIEMKAGQARFNAENTALKG